VLSSCISLYFRLKAGDHSEAIITCVKSFLETQSQPFFDRNE
jgi:hypothetical protein